MLRSNWLYLALAVVLLGVFGGALAWNSMLFGGEQPPPAAYDINFIASVCGLVSFGIQCVVWIANIVRWTTQRVKNA